MNAEADRINYLLEDMTQADLSSLTGIPQSTISYVSRGIRNLPQVYEAALRNGYQKTVYRQLTSIIPNSINANRFKWYAPDTVRDIKKGMESMLDEYTYGAIAGHFASIGVEPTADEISTAYETYYDKVREGMGKSRESYEIWQDYPIK